MPAITFGGAPLTMFGGIVSWFGSDALSRPQLRLEADGRETLDLSRSDIAAAFLDLGDAVTREATMDRPGANGTIDTTALTGARVVTLEVLVNAIVSDESRWELSQRLRAFTHPGLRPRLVFRPSDADPEFVVTLRRSQFSDAWRPMDRGHSKLTVQWVCPSGIIESAEQHVAVATASGAPSSLGLTFDLTFDATFPFTDPEGSVLINNAGSADVDPIIRLYGPFDGEASIINDLTEQALIIDGETVAQGDYVEFDTARRTILFNGDPTNSRYSRLVFPGSEWWTLLPGEQRIRFVAENFTSPARAEILWRDGWL